MQFNSHWITTKDFLNLIYIDNFHKEHCKHDSSEPVHHPNENYHCIFFSDFHCEQGGKYILRISADDCYRLYIDDRYICQGPSISYPFAYSYNELDISEYISPGEHRISVHVYYQGLLNRAYNSHDNLMGLICDLFCDNIYVFGTNCDWKYYLPKEYTTGKVIGYSTQFTEDIDFRKKIFAQEAAKAGIAENACLMTEHTHVFKSSPDKVLAEERVLPSSVVSLPSGYHFKFPSLIVGRVHFKAKGDSGEEIRVLCGAETEPDDENKTKYCMRDGCIYSETCTLSGNVDETDFFDYMSFQYVDLICKKETIDVSSVYAIAQHYPFDDKFGIIETNDKKLESIWNLCRNTAKYATQTGFLDCPSREKGQYLGDFTVSGLSFLYLTGDCSIYRKVLFDFASSARICPGLMAVAPGSYMQEIADFSLQYPLQVLNFYNYSGDYLTLLSLYDTIANLIAHFEKFAREDGLLIGVTDKWNLVDWPQNLRDGYDHPLSNPISCDALHNVINAHWIGANIVFEQISKILGKKVASRSESLILTFNETFFDNERMLYSDRPLCEYSKEGKEPHYALHSNILPVFYRFAKEDAFGSIANLIETKGLSCGVQFSYFVLKACANMGRYDLEYSLLTNEGEHSWMNMIREGASTLFEAWGKNQKWNTSLCHPWASAPVIAIYEDLYHNAPEDINIDLILAEAH